MLLADMGEPLGRVAPRVPRVSERAADWQRRKCENPNSACFAMTAFLADSNSISILTGPSESKRLLHDRGTQKHHLVAGLRKIRITSFIVSDTFGHEVCEYL
jgi:hypothetical protein